MRIICRILGVFCLVVFPSAAHAQSGHTQPLDVEKFSRLPKSDNASQGKWVEDTGCLAKEKRYGLHHARTLKCWAKHRDVHPAKAYEALYYLAESIIAEVPADIDRAIFFYELAAGGAQGKACKGSQEVSVNHNGQEICLPWRRSGTPAAQYQLGLLYAEGNLVSRDTAKARFWFQAAERRHLKIAGRALASLDDLEKRIAARQSQEGAQ